MARPVARVRVPGSERPRPASHRLLGPLAEDERLGVTILVRPAPGSPALPTLEDWQKTPLRERTFLTPEAYAQRHGAAHADLQAVEAFARTHGLQVAESHAGPRTGRVLGP